MVITTILTIAVCFCFLATGAYAAPSANGTIWKDNEILNEIMDTAKTIQTNNTYTYVHRAFYSDNYIIGMGWNLNDTIMDKEYDADSIEITLQDHSTIPVYFGDLFFGDMAGDAKDYLNDSNAISAIENLIYYLKTSGDLASFSAIFPALDTQLQEEYCPLYFHHPLYDSERTKGMAGQGAGR